MKGTIWASPLAAASSGPKASRQILARRSWLRSIRALPTHITAEAMPKPSMAMEITSEPKWAQLAMEKMRMTAICSAMIAPAISPTER